MRRVMLRTLDEFIADPRSLRSEYVREEGMMGLYVRVGDRPIITEDGAWPRRKMLDIANVTVAERKRGKGNFTRMIERLRRDHPTLPLYVECVQEERFRAKLERMGFKRVGLHKMDGGSPPSFVMWPAENSR